VKAIFNILLAQGKQDKRKQLYKTIPTPLVPAIVVMLSGRQRRARFPGVLHHSRTAPGGKGKNQMLGERTQIGFVHGPKLA
jgi:hypothetical protein